MEFKSRAVRSLVELHEFEMLRFLDAWDRFVASGAPMPDGRGAKAYRSRDTLVTHVLSAARGYLRWSFECLRRAPPDLDPETDPASVAARHRAFADGVLDAWRRGLATLADAEIAPQNVVDPIFRAGSGTFLSIESMLEHAVAHAMRHRVQLERILARDPGADFKSRAVRSLVELHEFEMLRFLDAWDRFVECGAPMPDARGDESYASPDTLVTHVVSAGRGYLTWVGECVGRPVTDVSAERDPARIGPHPRSFATGVLEAWRRHFAGLADSELGPTLFKTRWGEFFTVETMLEHALVHPMRHRIQLERLCTAP
jgi:hypothetical protein